MKSSVWFLVLVAGAVAAAFWLIRREPVAPSAPAAVASAELSRITPVPDAASSGAAAIDGKFSTLTGKAVFPGKSSDEVIRMSADPVCAGTNGGKPVLRGELIANNGGLANVFVYIKEGIRPGMYATAPPPPVELDQNGCLYSPHVIGLRTGQTLRIRNSDPTLHNIHALGKANPPFNVGMATRGQTVEKTFQKPEIMLRMKCDVHGWMGAYLGVLDHPFFAVTDANGGYTINGIPPGQYKLEAWHEKLGAREGMLTIPATGVVQAVNFDFSPGSK